MSSINEYVEKIDQCPPSEIEDNDLVELEHFLNSLYLQRKKDGLPADLEDAIVDALGLASVLSSEIKWMPNQPHNIEFYRTIKKLVRHLSIMDYYLNDFDRTHTRESLYLIHW